MKDFEDPFVVSSGFNHDEFTTYIHLFMIVEMLEGKFVSSFEAEACYDRYVKERRDKE